MSFSLEWTVRLCLWFVLAALTILSFSMPLCSVKITQMHVLAPTGTAGEDGNRRASICKFLLEMGNDQLK